MHNVLIYTLNLWDKKKKKQPNKGKGKHEKQKCMKLRVLEVTSFLSR